ncbi:methylated-DNA--[protein]-cysteine S-methyltransferase [Paenactinomyces guangxiensis]|uniref:Methylated-DNA--protein-cysteine methyltransferase n=1 Tax=Paenactinomyces guangxiensis TaxID=1490290 RepID=A0A7W1WP97_9BACL|nr:methylated-DNA--[protein]-cysteine S-methyltransferase [Paenactinomyces guangxiensis]MBA4493421.1 methylated-DNA--[protein]-cysteine S-methyltransferase [Paenactinomyces guangxiensis]MBH8590512.1 methylated-DNA--[protein]-cysteine S-methyltransferase [Paenactinomyces guangxiensis]
MAPATQTVVWSQMDSPIGPLTLAMTHQGLCQLTFNKKSDPVLGLQLWSNQWFRNPKLERNDYQLLPYVQQLDEYFHQSRREFDLPLDLYGTRFQKLVWKQLLEIPYGEVRSYKEVARAIGAPKAVRAVGGANNKNPVSIIVPCHRVIGSNGSLVGYGGGLHIKEYLLTLEGWYHPKE